MNLLILALLFVFVLYSFLNDMNKDKPVTTPKKFGEGMFCDTEIICDTFASDVANKK